MICRWRSHSGGVWITMRANYLALDVSKLLSIVTLLWDIPMTTEQKSNRSRRLRKKLYLEEFATQGFELDLEFTAVKDADQLDAFIFDFMTVVDANDMAFTGSACAETVSGVLIRIGRYDSVTTEQHAALVTWLEANADVKSVEAGELIDANVLL